MINIAVVGCGYWGANYVRLLGEMPNVHLQYACDNNHLRIESIASRFTNVKTSESTETVFADPAVDAVIIATPAGSHFAIAKAAMLAGKHILIEKPMTLDVAHAEELASISREFGKICMVGLTFMYNSGTLKVKELISANEFGSIYYMHFARTNMGPVRGDVSVIWDLAAHDIAIADYLMGESPEWVQANAFCPLNGKLPDFAFITLGYSGNRPANINVSWVDPNKVRRVVVVGSKSRIVFDDLQPVEPVRIFEKGISSSLEAGSFGEFKYFVREGDIMSPRILPSEPLRKEVEAFVDAISTGVPPITDADFGYRNVKTLAAIERSISLNGARVDI